MLRTATLRRAALRLVRTRPPNVAPPAGLPEWMDRTRVEYIMTRVAVLLVSMSDRDAKSFVKALDGTKHARAQAMSMAGWFQEWAEQHKARAKLARDAAGRLRDVSGRL